MSRSRITNEIIESVTVSTIDLSKHIRADLMNYVLKELSTKMPVVKLDEPHVNGEPKHTTFEARMFVYTEEQMHELIGHLRQLMIRGSDETKNAAHGVMDVLNSTINIIPDLNLFPDTCKDGKGKVIKMVVRKDKK